jgi:predicted metalloendopeptidase
MKNVDALESTNDSDAMSSNKKSIYSGDTETCLIDFSQQSSQSDLKQSPSSCSSSRRSRSRSGTRGARVEQKRQKKRLLTRVLMSKTLVLVSAVSSALAAVLLIGLIILMSKYSSLRQFYEADRAAAGAAAAAAAAEAGSRASRTNSKSESANLMPNTMNDSSLFCHSKACYKASNFILENLDQVSNVCDDFYSHACGTWLESKSEDIDQFTVAQEKLYQDLSEIFDAAHDELTESSIIHNFKKYYKSCSNPERIEQYADKEFVNFMQKEMGEWPLIAKSQIGNGMTGTGLSKELEQEKDDRKQELEQEREDIREKKQGNKSKLNQINIEYYIHKLTKLQMPMLFRFASDDHNSSRILMHVLLPEDFCLKQQLYPKDKKTTIAFKTLMRNFRDYFYEAVNNVDYYASSLSISNSTESSGSASGSDSGSFESLFEQQVDDMLDLANRFYFVNQNVYQCHQPPSSSGGSANRPSKYELTIDELNEKINKEQQQQQQQQQYQRQQQPQQQQPLFDFAKYIGYLNDGANTKLPNNTKIVIKASTLKLLHDLLDGIEHKLNMSAARMQRALKNLVYFHTLVDILKPLYLFATPHLHITFPIRYYSALFEYTKRVYNESPISSFKSIHRVNAHKNCAYLVLEAFSVVDSLEIRELQRFYITHKFNENVKSETKRMLDILIESSHELIVEQAWIDESTKAAITRDLYEMDKIILYSDSIFDPAWLAEHNVSDKHSQYEYQLTQSYIVNKMLINMKNYEREFDLVGKSQRTRIRDKKHIFDIFLTNLIYLKDHNSLFMPIGTLIEPIFDMQQPTYLNYATIGSYLAHEIWHMIHEDLIRSSNASLQAYVEKLECLKENYERFVLHKFNYTIDGDWSLSEQIADYFGIVLALRAYKKLSDERKANDQYVEEKAHSHLYSHLLLPGLKYNQEQLYFIRHAQSYCRKKRIHEPSQFRQPHVIHEFRAFQSRLIPEFLNAFNCRPEPKDYLKSCKIFD